ncbi:MAG: NAD(+) kinase [Proteobacteria bacterium]|nr:NAD(+) kinase [Pseudomonadota bacterium]
MKRPHILVVFRSSAFTRQVSEKHHSGVAKLVEARDPLVENIIAAHEQHETSMRRVESSLKERKLDSTWTGSIDDLNSNDYDLVVTVGGDGTVLHASHAIGDAPVLGVNSSPSTSVGFLTAADAEGFGAVLDQVLDRALEPVTLCRMEVRVNGEVVTKRALNDVLFCHDCPASTTRYMLTFDGKNENQLSSGVWIATAAGSTAAIKSAGGKAMPPRSRRLQFVVREPFQSNGTIKQRQHTLNRGFISDGEALSIRSKTEVARLYVDGPHVVFPVDFGDVATFTRSDEPFHLFGYNKKEE